MARKASVVVRHRGDRVKSAEVFTQQPTLGWLAAVDADVGPVKGRNGHRTRGSKPPSQRCRDLRERHRVVRVQNLKALAAGNACNQSAELGLLVVAPVDVQAQRE